MLLLSAVIMPSWRFRSFERCIQVVGDGVGSNIYVSSDLQGFSAHVQHIPK